MGYEVQSTKVLTGLIRDAIEMERVSEIGEAQLIYESTDDDKLKSLLFNVKLEEEEHLHTLLDIAETLDMEVNMVELERKTWDKRLMREKMPLNERIKQLKKQEANCKDFYSRVAKSLRRSDLNGLNTAAMAAEFERLAMEEEKHIEELDGKLDRLKRLI